MGLWACVLTPLWPYMPPAAVACWPLPLSTITVGNILHSFFTYVNWNILAIAHPSMYPLNDMWYPIWDGATYNNGLLFYNLKKNCCKEMARTIFNKSYCRSGL